MVKKKIKAITHGVGVSILRALKTIVIHLKWNSRGQQLFNF